MRTFDNPFYIWQQPNWPGFRYDVAALAEPLSLVYRAQGRLHGVLGEVGASQRELANLQVLVQEVVKTSEIEGERLNLASVRSSIARRLGVDIGGLAPTDRHVEGVVEMVLDATARFDAPLTSERLFGWHAALFPTGYSGMARIKTGEWRDDATGPMQVVSGPHGRETVHFEAPAAAALPTETAAFLAWFNSPVVGDALVKAGLAHLWLVTLHPFDDGNGRISRAVGDMALARADGTPQRFYSLSAQIQRERNDYYDQLESAQGGGLDVTAWLAWFLGCLLRAVESADDLLAEVLAKARFWQQWAGTPMNERQIKLMNRLLDGFRGKLTTAKWAAIAKCSPDTALRDIGDLLARGVLVKTEGGGRSAGYALADATRPA